AAPPAALRRPPNAGLASTSLRWRRPAWWVGRRSRRASGLRAATVAGGLLHRAAVVQVIPTVAVELVASREVGARFVPAPEPGIVVLVPGRFLAAVLVPLDLRGGPQDACALGLGAERASGHERADVHPDAIVDVGVPADRL